MAVLFHCRFKGHIIDEKVLDGRKIDDGWIETPCLRCNYPVFACIDPEDTNYYLVSEDG